MVVFKRLEDGRGLGYVMIMFRGVMFRVYEAAGSMGFESRDLTLASFFCSLAV